MADPYSQALNIAAPFSRLGSQMFQGQALYEQGRAKSALQESQRAAMESHSGLYNAQAQKAQEEAAGLAQRRQYQTPEFASQIAATLNGLSPEQGTELASGNAPWATPEQVQSFNRGRGAHLAQLGATGNTTGEQVIKAFSDLLGQGRTEQAIANPKQAGVIAQGVAAGGGKPLVNNLGGNGVFNQFTGGQELNAIGKTAAQQNSASAANSYASAGEHKAGAELKRSKIGQPTINPDGSVTAPTGKPIKLSSAAEKELFEADDSVQAGKNIVGILKGALDLNDKAYSGYFAKSRAVARSNLPGESEQANATINLDNMMTGQALESLKMVFGGMPTEGERKILLEMQASAEKTPKQRKDIIERAVKAAEGRIIFNTNKSKALRSGTHNSVDPQAAPQGGDIDALLKKYGN